jgi:hypothetical protein
MAKPMLDPVDDNRPHRGHVVASHQFDLAIFSEQFQHVSFPHCAINHPVAP